MKKVYITGSVGSGKTTFAKKISNTHLVKHYELDEIIREYQGDTRVKKTPEKQASTIRQIDGQGYWIIEGTFRKECEVVLELADEIVIVDTHYHVIIKRIISRYIKQLLRLEKSHYKPSFKMFRMMFVWAKGYEKDKKSFMETLSPYHHKVTLLKSADMPGYIKEYA